VLSVRYIVFTHFLILPWPLPNTLFTTFPGACKQVTSNSPFRVKFFALKMDNHWLIPNIKHL
jgi:hypothetical protein